MIPLAEQSCLPAAGEEATRLGPAEMTPLIAELSTAWQVVDQHHLFRRYEFEDFQGGLDLVNRLGALAEQESHHPDLFLAWGRVEVTIFTHSVGGLTRSDVIMAAKIDRL